MDELEQHAIGIAMHDAGDRRMRVIADRIGVLARRATNSSALGMNCRAIGSSGSSGVDQRGDVRRHRDRIARGDLFQIGKSRRGRKAVGDQLGGLAQRRGRLED